jgi:uncharacterized protein (UPF0332 family)/predicted nucleotidyltransferase
MSAPAARPTAGLRDDPKLARIADTLREAFGARLVSALLFGSRARGDHRENSDYDVAVFLEDYDATRDRDIVRDTRDRLGEDAFSLQFWPFAKDGLAERTTLMFNIRNEAVPLPGFAWPAVVAPPIAPDGGPMKPETNELLGSADATIRTAQALLKAGFAKPAAREAYQAVLRAARALVFEERNSAPKTHQGTVTLFSDLAIKTGRVDEGVGAALARGLAVRLDVDYAAVPQTTEAQAAEYVGRAVEFVAAVKRLIDAKA